MSTEVLKKFGRYFLLDLLAQGGMAEIYRARLASKDGAGRLVIVKRIQAGFGNNVEFLQMFRSEIKVTMGLNHQNIVQVYDFGEEQNQPFIAMEFVDGKNLRQLLNRFREMGQGFPVEVATHVIEQAASGLHYAHSFKDKITGESLNVVHRDISPQNILISYDGSVKIIDFGIAKATTNSEHTRAGVIKGKPSYLAPEQISGDPLDGRTDLFALGAVFWELLVGKKLFSGENDLAVLKMIESCSSTVRPPSELNPNVPKELDALILKLLSKNPDKRFQSGEELQRALRRFLNAYSPDFVPTDLSSIVKELFQKEIVEDRKKIQRLNERVEQLLMNEVPAIGHQGGESKSERREETTTFVARNTGLPKGPVELKVEDFKQQAPVVVERPVLPPPVRQPNGTRAGTLASVPPPGTRTALGPVSGSYQKKERTEESSFFKWVALVVAFVGTSWVAPRMGWFEVPILSPLLGSRLQKFEPSRSLAGGENSLPTIDPAVSETPTEEIKKAKLRLNIFPEGLDTTVSLNGKRVESTASGSIEVNADVPLELLVQRPGFESFRSEFRIDSRALASNGEYVKEISLEPERGREPSMVIKGDQRGFLTVRSTPGADAKIFVNGQYWGRKYAPFEKLPVPVGKISLHLYNATLDLEDQINIDIEKDSMKRVQSNLRPKRR